MAGPNRRLSQREQAEFIAFIIEQVTAEMVEALKQQAKERGEFVPDGVAESISGAVLQDSTGDITRAALTLIDEGRLVEMRRLNFQKRPITQTDNFILNWVKKHRNRVKGGLPGYATPANAKISEEKQLERIASAIIAARGNKEYVKKNRQKTWRYAKTAYRYVAEMQERLIRRQAEYFAEALGGEFKNAVDGTITL